MFNKNFFPTPVHVIEMMLNGHNIEGKTILEPSAGKGDIVDYLLLNGAKDVIACELNDDLRKIVTSKCNVIGEDFLKLTSDKISHVDYIIMNPPFDKADQHILHAWNIAPAGCKIIALCNLETVENTYHNRVKQELSAIIEGHGDYQDLGNCFSQSERKTSVEVALVSLFKPAQENNNAEFEGFFIEDDQPEEQANGIMPYNAIRDLVQRYINALKLFDQQLDLGVQMNDLTSTFYNQYNQTKLAFIATNEEKPKTRNDFKKEMQKAGWNFIFTKLNMEKYSTKGLREDLNVFIEKQEHIPFTMRNIYKMLEIIIGTQSSRMDKALLEVFDRLTEHHDENRFHVEGWKTNSHYLINEKFIMPYMCPTNKWHTGNEICFSFGSRFELIQDMVKALCYISGINYDDTTPLNSFISRLKCQYGRWYSWGFFEIKAFKKGTVHFKFQDEDLWAQFNQRIAKLKGYPLYEAVKTKDTPRREAETAKRYKPTVLATFPTKAA